MKGDGPGQVKAIGVSNFDDNTLKALMDMANKKISVVQNWMDPFHQVFPPLTLLTKHVTLS